jgi:hypothetical protein
MASNQTGMYGAADITGPGIAPRTRPGPCGGTGARAVASELLPGASGQLD